MVENDGEDGDIGEKTITFLYKFTTGPCPKAMASMLPSWWAYPAASLIIILCNNVHIHVYILCTYIL